MNKHEHVSQRINTPKIWCKIYQITHTQFALNTVDAFLD